MLHRVCGTHPSGWPRRLLTVSLLGAAASLFSSPAAGVEGEGPIRFREVPQAGGIAFTLENSASPRKHLPETMPGGGRVRLRRRWSHGHILSNVAAIPSLAKEGHRYWNRLSRNMGGMQFRDVTAGARVEGAGYSMGAAAADFDNDGHPDLFVAGIRRNILYRDQGDGTFEDVT